MSGRAMNAGLPVGAQREQAIEGAQLGGFLIGSRAALGEFQHVIGGTKAPLTDQKRGGLEEAARVVCLAGEGNRKLLVHLVSASSTAATPCCSPPLPRPWGPAETVAGCGEDKAQERRNQDHEILRSAWCRTAIPSRGEAMRRGVAGFVASLLLVAAGARASESDLTAKMAEMSYAKSCGFQQIACNQTKVGTIDPSDCALFAGQYTDFWEFTGATGDHVTVDVHSTDFDTFAALLSPTGSNGTDSSDNDSGPGTDSRIEATLDANGAWDIGVANWNPFQYGAYSVTLSCGATPACVASDTTLCLGNGRFKVEATYTSAGSGSGTAHNVKLTDDTGYFWFFNQSNVEMVVKVLNGCPLNNHFWVYAGGLTDQGVTFTVTDTLMNVSKTYTNPLGTKWVTITDSSALASCP